ncbi:MAG: hypothetical protein GXP32_09775 [Kiritimatiellaeota bacterium]|nr:hypothetical protein [Kiritimatiellota bacterium]
MSKFLGLDLGTTKVAAVIVDTDGILLEHASAPTRADVEGLPAGFAEQYPAKIAAALDECVSSLSKINRSDVVAVGLTGQMHGVVLWEDSAPDCHLNLVTWQDKRCDADGFLAELADSTGIELKSGFGAATLAWLVSNESLNPKWRNAGTIHDWLVARLCGLERPVMDPTNASSWGAFDLESGDWNWEALDALRIPRELMPRIVPTGEVVGRLGDSQARDWGLSPGIPLTAAIGDNQASLLATLDDWDADIALTIGTGAQLSVVVDSALAAEFAESVGCEFRPFLDGRLIAVAAPLCGGAAFAWLVDWFKEWCAAFGIEPPEDSRLYETFIRLGLDAAGSSIPDISPSFLGERSDPDSRGVVSNIDLDNFTPGGVARGLAFGLARNLKNMLPSSLLDGRGRIVASGNALRRNKLLAEAVGEVFGKPLEFSASSEEAACGAAILAAGLR